MSWLKDIIIKLLDVINSLPTKMKCFYVGAFIFLFAGYFFYVEYHNYKIESMRITGQYVSQPNIVETKQTNKRLMAGGIYKDETKITAKSSRNTNK